MFGDRGEAAGADYWWREVVEVIVVVGFCAAWCAGTTSATTRSGDGDVSLMDVCL